MSRLQLLLDAPTRWASPLIVIVIVLAPPLDVFLAGRNLYGEQFYNAAPAAAPFPIMTLATAIVGLTCCWMIVLNLRDQSLTGESARVMIGFLIFFVTNVILSVPFGESVHISRSNIYPLVLFTAFYLSRDEGAAKVIDAAKLSLLIFMIASLAGGVLYPEMTRRVWAPEVRLPFIDFRFWGFGEHANAIAPMALVLTILTLYRPFARRWLTTLAHVCSGLVIVLAQSQTVWFIAIVTLPVFIAYQTPNRWQQLRHAARSPQVWGPVAVISLFAVTSVGLFMMLSGNAATSGGFDGGGAPVLTGRLDVWRIALETFESHPFFGYGLLAWEQEFRDFYGVPWALHAHNQLLQSLSVAGLVGATGLITYVLILGRSSLARARSSRGLAPALLFIVVVRMLTEVPLNLGAILLGDTVIHLLLFRILTTPTLASSVMERARGARCEPAFTENLDGQQTISPSPTWVRTRPLGAEHAGVRGPERT